MQRRSRFVLSLLKKVWDLALNTTIFDQLSLGVQILVMGITEMVKARQVGISAFLLIGNG
ncbi:hypothetical protein [Microseira wollei]|uniref:hypothetical protein n=1 Tax=Microseira wollei TaxID=467598 RepID=UPI001CFD4460|nr:hypothetical protein [Microseira wollei]